MPYKDPEKQRRAARASYERTGLLERRKQRKREIRALLKEMKLERGCADCGFNSHAEALDFDHRPEEEKKFGIKNMGHRGLKAVLDEVAKCDVRCANCHRIKSEERRLASIVHG